MTLSRRVSVALPTVVCAVVFFLASADRFFAIRFDTVNVRFAAVALLGAIAVFVATRWRNSTDDIRVLARAWLPFVVVYGVAVATSPTPAPGLLKLGWFAFDFVAAFALTSLFAFGDIVRGYFLSFMVIASIIAIDFMTGFDCCFYGSPEKQAQWRAFRNKISGSDEGDSLQEVMERLVLFLTLPLDACRAHGKFAAQWPAGGPWTL